MYMYSPIYSLRFEVLEFSLIHKQWMVVIRNLLHCAQKVEAGKLGSVFILENTCIAVYMSQNYEFYDLYLPP